MSIACLARVGSPRRQKVLSYRERRILELHYGLDDEQPRTLADLAGIFDITLERVRQIEHKSLRKLRALAA
jgi:RNA polymerase primary sigma factor